MWTDLVDCCDELLDVGGIEAARPLVAINLFTCLHRGMMIMLFLCNMLSYRSRRTPTMPRRRGSSSHPMNTRLLPSLESRGPPGVMVEGICLVGTWVWAMCRFSCVEVLVEW